MTHELLGVSCDLDVVNHINLQQLRLFATIKSLLHNKIRPTNLIEALV